MLKYGLNRASGIGHRASGIGHRASGISYRQFSQFLAQTQSLFPLKNYLFHCFNISNNLRIKHRYLSLSPNKINSLLHKVITIFCFCLFIFSDANSLNVATAKIIEGNAPQVVNTELAANKHGFTVNGVFYSEANNNINGNKVKEFSGDLRLKDFTIKNFYYDSLDNKLNFADNDGDDIDTTRPFLLTNTSFKWYDANGQVLTDQSKTISTCENESYSLPLTLEITTQLKTYSKYGIPNESDFVPITKRYQIVTTPEICGIKPNQMFVHPNRIWASPYIVNINGVKECNFKGYDSLEESISDPKGTGWNQPGTEKRNDYCGGGYDANVFDPKLGFKPSAKPSFPTSGFPGAEFRILVKGLQTDYTYSVINNSGGGVSVDKMGNVTLNNKPTGEVTVRIKTKWESSFLYDYTFNPTKVWIEPQEGLYSTYAQAIERCGGETNIPTRVDMTNSPNAPATWTELPLQWDTFTRAIGEGLFAEWGETTKTAYPKSNWQQQWQWFYSRDHFDNRNHPGYSDIYAIDAWIGQIQVWGNGVELRAMCKR